MASTKRQAPPARETARQRSGKARPAAAVDSMAFTVKVRPPGEEHQHEIEVDLAAMTLNERQVVKRAMAQFVDADVIEVMAVHAWAVWRRDHPDCQLSDWVDGITFGELLGFDEDKIAGLPWQTPEEFRPEG